MAIEAVFREDGPDVPVIGKRSGRSGHSGGDQEGPKAAWKGQSQELGGNSHRKNNGHPGWLVKLDYVENTPRLPRNESPFLGDGWPGVPRQIPFFRSTRPAMEIPAAAAATPNRISKGRCCQTNAIEGKLPPTMMASGQRHDG